MTAPTINRATDELVALLLATRTDWTEFDVRNAIAGATTLAYGWAQITRGLVALALDPTGQPRDLTPAGDTRHDPEPGSGLPASPEAVAEVAAARERLAAVRARNATAEETR